MELQGTKMHSSENLRIRKNSENIRVEWFDALFLWTIKAFWRLQTDGSSNFGLALHHLLINFGKAAN